MKTMQELLMARAKATGGRTLPFVILFVFWSTIIACTLGRSISLAGYTVQGLVWMMTLVFSVFILARNAGKISLPWYLWTPWAGVLVIFQIFSKWDDSLQRTVMMLCPLVVGHAVSTLTVRSGQLSSFYGLVRQATITFFVFIVFSTGIIFTGALPAITGLAPQVMTGSVLAVYFAVRYSFQGSKQMLYYWLGLVLIPIIALTRMGILATVVSLPLTLAPLKLVKRLIVIAGVCILGTGMFYTERIQQKMFYTGEGELADVRLDNPQFRTTGRVAMWDAMSNEIEKSPWLGYGANATDEFLRQYAGFTTHPHNDWLRLRFDYGYVGAIVFGLCILMQILHAWKKARETSGETGILFYTGATAFIPFVMFMFTDNIILYAAFFGNLHFAILGLAYASARTTRDDRRRHEAHLRRIRSEAMRDQFLQNNVPVG